MHVHRMNERGGWAVALAGGGRVRARRVPEKGTEWLKSSRHNDPAICSASVHNDGDRIQQKISMPIGISFN